MRGYTALSLLGLIISLSGTVIISRYLHQEWTVDRFMPALDRTYVLGIQFNKKGLYDSADYLASSYDPNQEASFISPVEGQSEIEAYCDINLRKEFPVAPESHEVFFPAAITVKDSMFFQVYPLHIVEGARLLTANGQCMVSEELARRLFPDESAVGKSINIEDGTPHTIQAVFRQPDTKSTLRFDLIQFRKDEIHSNSLGLCLVLLREGASAEAYNERQPVQTMTLHANRELRFCLRPYRDLIKTLSHWQGYANAGYPCIQPSSSPAHLWMLLFVAVLLLFVGLFNFVNLYAVMRRRRQHELHVRRIFGASRWDVFCQLYAETFVLGLLTMVGVWTVVELSEPLLATYYDIEVQPQWKFDMGLTAVLMVGLPLISPLWSPGGERSSKAAAFFAPHRGATGGMFLFLQFFISLTLLNVSLYFMRQLNVMMTTDPGFRTKGLLSVLLQPERNVESWSEEEWDKHVATANRNRDIILQRLAANPHIKGFCFDPQLIGDGSPIEVNKKYKMNIHWISPEAMQLFGIETVAGRTFNDTTDIFEQYLCLVNETAIRQLGIKDFRHYKLQFPQRLWYSSGLDFGTNPPYEIVGVVRDFHSGRMSEPLMPTAYFFDGSFKRESFFGLEGKQLLIDVAEGHEEEVLGDLRDLVHELSGTNELNYQWLEDQRRALYSEDQRTARIFVTFSLLAIAVTCLGVLGLMMFDVRRRYREIALRKVNGATFRDIALLLSRRYLTVFAIAAVASLPVSLIVIHRLMASYTIRTSFAWWIPLLSIVLILALCALTLWYQVWKATRIKPYKVLKEQ